MAKSKSTNSAETHEEFFSEEEKLRQQAAIAEAAFNELNPEEENPVAPEAAAEEPWDQEPTGEMVKQHMRINCTSYDESYAAVKKELQADARRLAETFPNVTAKISAELRRAQLARDRALNLLAAHQGKLESIISSIRGLWKLRAQIQRVRLLLISDDVVASEARKVIDLWVQRGEQGGSESNIESFEALANDICWRTALNVHVQNYVRELENSAKDFADSIRADAATGKIDVKKVLATMSSDINAGRRGSESIDFGLCNGLL